MTTMGQWWVDSKIESTVTRAFVQSHLLPGEIERLDRPVAFGGEDLTERTYWDSIRNDAPRLLLILIDLGVPDQIFGVIDDGWDDAELPIALEDVDRLQLTAARDERVEKKFFQRQFHYLLKPLQRGSHQTYANDDVVPLDVVERPVPLTPHKSNGVEKAKLPNAPGMVFCRRKYNLGQNQGSIPQHEFLEAIQGIKGLQNDHLVSYWASYTHRGVGYVLFTPPNDLTLKSFLATTPSSFKNLAKKDRRELIMNWILCLVDTLCYLHSKGRTHGYIKPSTILLNGQNHVFFCDATRLTPETLIHHTDKASFDREWYDYAAPESWFRPPGSSSPPSRFMGPGSPSTSDDGPFSIMRGPDMGTSPNTMYLAPSQQLSPHQADIFSLGCIILELLSFLVKRSTSKFSSFRSAKHKTAGRGGAVLDTSFHKNLGQVESWMSSLAKDAAKKISDRDGANMFRGVAPILHVVTGMLSANPYDRPAAVDVQQRIYQILTDTCGLVEPHCVHQYSTELDYSFGQMRIQPTVESMAGFPRRHPSLTYGTPRTFQHSRNGSSGGYSQTSRTTSSSEADGDVILNTGPSSPQRIRPAATWARNAAYMNNSGVQQGPLYAAGP